MFKTLLRKVVRFKALSATLLAALMLVAGGFVWARLTLRGVANGPLILHFDDLSGITSVGSAGVITFIGILGIGVVLLNAIIALGLEERDRVLGKLAAAVTLIFAVLLFIAFAAIISVN